jgi:hypothetical protein
MSVKPSSSSLTALEPSEPSSSSLTAPEPSGPPPGTGCRWWQGRRGDAESGAYAKSGRKLFYLEPAIWLDYANRGQQENGRKYWGVFTNGGRLSPPSLGGWPRGCCAKTAALPLVAFGPQMRETKPASMGREVVVGAGGGQRKVSRGGEHPLEEFTVAGQSRGNYA